MASVLAWLDADSDDQARMREIIKLFTDKDSRDELGLGQVRDAISDGLVPGTSVLLTRARYLLFIPWCFQLAEGKPDPAAAADKLERRLISSLRSSGSDDLTGLLGARVGQALQTLPSTIYWWTLRRYGIVGEEYVWKHDVFQPVAHPLDGDDATALKPNAWSPTIPPPPAGFPDVATDAFTLTHDEASWLRDRILDGAPDTLMAHLAEHAPSPGSSSAWTDPTVRSLGGPAADLLRNAQAFSTAMHGASLLYNLLLAEEYEGYVIDEQRRHQNPVDRYRTELADWSERATAARITAWDVNNLWEWIDHTARAVIAPASRRFITEWVELLQGHGTGAIADNQSAKSLVRSRERRQKGSMARLGNPKRIAAWSGAAGAAAMVFRWATVRDLMLDIHAGLSRDA